ncbi:IS701 family transposase [Vitiosangium sp. GDMCC 1.1324]|uniref:IS701 family transposase n=1 Tax=Vitiosangium sp. (strain GDMCC 1.1324) TaxID=2138576 RepID=UPI00130EEFFC|nr:IS701 family transposase [Vitiosangium sp. GDMCC 1.1324]
MSAATPTQGGEAAVAQTLPEGLRELAAWLAPHFRRREALEAAGSFLRALLSRAERKNAWGLAEEAGKTDPYAFQHLLGRARWDEDAVRDGVLAYARQRLGEGGVLAVAEMDFLKKGDKSAGVAHQYAATAGRIENCQVGVFLAYVTREGRSLVDRELYLPEEWTKHRNRRHEAGIPEEVVFRTKPQLAQVMLQRALDAGLAPSWVIGNEVYGSDGNLRRVLERHHQRYLLAVTANTSAWRATTRLTAGRALKELKKRDWARLSAGAGPQGPRLYDWARMSVKSHTGTLSRWFLFQRGLSDETEVAFYLVHAPANTSLASMVEAAGSRWPVEECFESARGEVGLDDYEVRSWTGWYRHMTLCLAAHTFLAAARARANSKEGLLPKASSRPHGKKHMSAFRRRQGLRSSGSPPRT